MVRPYLLSWGDTNLGDSPDRPNGCSPVFGRNEDSIDSYENNPENADRDYLKELVTIKQVTVFCFCTNNSGRAVACAAMYTLLRIRQKNR